MLIKWRMQINKRKRDGNKDEINKSHVWLILEGFKHIKSNGKKTSHFTVSQIVLISNLWHSDR